MVKIDLLKKLVLIADKTAQFSDANFKEDSILVNALLPNKELVEYSFQVLEIKYETYTPAIMNDRPPTEVNVVFDNSASFEVVYLITYVLNEVYGRPLHIYLSYATKPIYRHLTSIGTYIKSHKKRTNISRSIRAEEILQLKHNKADKGQLITLFPNVFCSADGLSSEVYKDKEEEDHEYNHKSYYPSSFNFIDDVLGGDPDAYWNID